MKRRRFKQIVSLEDRLVEEATQLREIVDAPDLRRIREVLRLRHQGLTERVIARMLGVSNGVVHGYVRRARLRTNTGPYYGSWFTDTYTDG